MLLSGHSDLALRLTVARQRRICTGLSPIVSASPRRRGLKNTSFVVWMESYRQSAPLSMPEPLLSPFFGPAKRESEVTLFFPADAIAGRENGDFFSSLASANNPARFDGSRSCR